MTVKRHPIDRRTPFWDRAVRAASGCLEWTRAAHSDGYGQYRGKRANRVAWALTYGPIPVGMLVCHRCNNPKCIEPGHLYLGDHRQNYEDAVRDGLAKIGEAHPLARLSNADIDLMRGLRFFGLSHSQIAARVGCGRGYVSQVLRGEKRRSIA